MKNTWTPFQSPHNYKPEQNKLFDIYQEQLPEGPILQFKINHFEISYKDKPYYVQNDILETEIDDETSDIATIQ